MKKEERLHRLFGDIDDELVADAARKPTRKAVWMPLVAAAACVALSVGLWQGGVFDPTAIPVEPSKTDPTKSTEPSKTETTEPTEPYILVGGEDNSGSRLDSYIPSLKERLVSPVLEEKMEEYRDVNAVFQVVVHFAMCYEDDEEYYKFRDANEEYQSLQKQYEEADKAQEEASDRLHESRVNDDDPQIQAALLEEFRKADEIYNDLSHKVHVLEDELFMEYVNTLREERISYAAKYSKTEPISGYGVSGNGYYMELTADAINELADRGGYAFRLASEKRKEGVYWVYDA